MVSASEQSDILVSGRWPPAGGEGTLKMDVYLQIQGCILQFICHGTVPFYRYCDTEPGYAENFGAVNN